MTRLQTPIRQRGAVAERWAAWHEKQRAIVSRRAGWRCEACGSNMRPLEWAHLVGRNNKGIGEPWCSTAELTVALCTSKAPLGCHEQIDRGLNSKLLDELRWLAAARLMSAYPVDSWLAPLERPLDDIRQIVRTLEEKGWAWDGEGIAQSD